MKRFLFALCIISLIVGNTASGWWGGGHDILTQAAVKALPEELPAFFRAGIRMIAHCSYDPDTAKKSRCPSSPRCGTPGTLFRPRTFERASVAENAA
jgi:hypothetical protein